MGAFNTKPGIIPVLYDTLMAAGDVLYTKNQW